MVGAREVRTFGIAAIGLTLVAAVAWSLYSLWYFWPHTPARTAEFVYFGWRLQLTPDQQFFLTVSLAGALGGLLHSLRSLSTYVGERYLFRSWLLYYLALPLVGAVLATIAYIVLRAGLLPGGASESQPDPYGIAGISALVGLFSAQTVEKLQAVFSTLFTNAPQNADSLSDLSSGTDDPGDPATEHVEVAATSATSPAWPSPAWTPPRSRSRPRTSSPPSSRPPPRPDPSPCPAPRPSPLTSSSPSPHPATPPAASAGARSPHLQP